VSSVLLAAGDALGAQAGVEWLVKAGLPVRAVSGMASASTLSALETMSLTESLTDLVVLGLSDLMSPEGAAEWMPA